MSQWLMQPVAETRYKIDGLLRLVLGVGSMTHNIRVLYLYRMY